MICMVYLNYRKKIENYLNSINYQKEYKDNPIYNALTIQNLLKPSETDEDNKQMQILQQILEKVAYNQMPRINLSEDNGYSRYYVQLKNIKAVQALNSYLTIYSTIDISQMYVDEKNLKIELGLLDEDDINNIIIFLEEKEFGYKIVKY